MKVAIVYDRINKIGGAERILLALHEIWPEAPLFSAVYNKKTAQWANIFKVETSFLQKFPLAKSTHEIYPWLAPLAFENLNFENFDLVISLTSAEAKGIITKPKTLHVCYCLTPTRYLWSHQNEYLDNPGFYFLNPLIKIIFKPLIKFLKEWDLTASNRPDTYLAICNNVQERIKKFYKKESQVVYPPVDMNKFYPTDQNQVKDKFFLIVSRLVPYKRIDIAVRAFNQLGWKLKIVGTGRDKKRLKKMAESNIKFLGELTDRELLGYYQNCEALIFPQEEDFGITCLEAQACGVPVIAFKGGGAKETVIEDVTGDFFYPQTSTALINKLITFKKSKFKKDDCRKNANKFSLQRFKIEFKDLALKIYFNYTKGGL